MIRFVLALFTGGSSIPWLIGGVVAAGIAFFSWLAIHDHEVWNKATEEFNSKQDAIVQQQKEEFQKKTVEIEDSAARIRAILADQQKDTHDKLVGIMKGAEGKGSSASSAYIKSIVKQLNEAYGEKK